MPRGCAMRYAGLLLVCAAACSLADDSTGDSNAKKVDSKAVDACGCVLAKQGWSRRRRPSGCKKTSMKPRCGCALGSTTNSLEAKECLLHGKTTKTLPDAKLAKKCLYDWDQKLCPYSHQDQQHSLYALPGAPQPSKNTAKSKKQKRKRKMSSTKLLTKHIQLNDFFLNFRSCTKVLTKVLADAGLMYGGSMIKTVKGDLRDISVSQCDAQGNNCRTVASESVHKKKGEKVAGWVIAGTSCTNGNIIKKEKNTLRPMYSIACSVCQRLRKTSIREAKHTNVLLKVPSNNVALAALGELQLTAARPELGTQDRDGKPVPFFYAVRIFRKMNLALPLWLQDKKKKKCAKRFFLTPYISAKAIVCYGTGKKKKCTSSSQAKVLYAVPMTRMTQNSFYQCLTKPGSGKPGCSTRSLKDLTTCKFCHAAKILGNYEARSWMTHPDLAGAREPKHVKVALKKLGVRRNALIIDNDPVKWGKEGVRPWLSGEPSVPAQWAKIGLTKETMPVAFRPESLSRECRGLQCFAEEFIKLQSSDQPRLNSFKSPQDKPIRIHGDPMATKDMCVSYVKYTLQAINATGDGLAESVCDRHSTKNCWNNPPEGKKGEQKECKWDCKHALSEYGADRSPQCKETQKSPVLKLPRIKQDYSPKDFPKTGGKFLNPYRGFGTLSVSGSSQNRGKGASQTLLMGNPHSSVYACQSDSNKHCMPVCSGRVGKDGDSFWGERLSVPAIIDRAVWTPDKGNCYAKRSNGKRFSDNSSFFRNPGQTFAGVRVTRRLKYTVFVRAKCTALGAAILDPTLEMRDANRKQAQARKDNASKLRPCSTPLTFDIAYTLVTAVRCVAAKSTNERLGEWAGKSKRQMKKGGDRKTGKTASQKKKSGSIKSKKGSQAHAKQSGWKAASKVSKKGAPQYHMLTKQEQQAGNAAKKCFRKTSAKVLYAMLLREPQATQKHGSKKKTMKVNAEAKPICIPSGKKYKIKTGEELYRELEFGPWLSSENKGGCHSGPPTSWSKLLELPEQFNGGGPPHCTPSSTKKGKNPGAGLNAFLMPYMGVLS